MITCTMHLQSATQYERVDGVESFIGEDASGKFGILPGHARFMTALVFGLARFRTAAGWQYLALPGGLLYFAGGELTINTRRFLLDVDYTRISRLLSEQLLAEEETLHRIKESVHRMEQEMLRRIWEIGRIGGTAS